MIRLLFVFLALSTFASAAPANKCSLNLDWKLEKQGLLTDQALDLTDFIFLSEKQILIANLPAHDQPASPLKIYTLEKNGFVFDGTASALLPSTSHPRNIIYQDILDDAEKEIIISDHGSDAPPFTGASPVILKHKFNRWIAEASTHLIPPAFTFNSSVLPLPGGEKALFRANVRHGGLDLFVKKNDRWIDKTSSLPASELKDNCFMTSLTHDLDNDGKVDLFLGGCDQMAQNSSQTHDRILVSSKDKWALLPVDVLPPRKLNSMWGTVFVKTLNYNGDNRTDLIVATHDWGFHQWNIAIYENQSRPGSIKFKPVSIPLLQEERTEGFIYAVEDFEISGNQALLIEVRSVLRDETKKHPALVTRFMMKEGNSFVDHSACLPEIIKTGFYRAKLFPGTRNKLLMMPYKGQIYSLTITKK